MAYIAKGKPFEYRGAVNVEDCKTAADVMSVAHLDWTVAKCELVAQMPNVIQAIGSKGFVHGNEFYRTCPNAYATYRTDCNLPLGIVKDRYTPVQNVDAFTFFDSAIGKDKAMWQTAGFFGNGERIFVSAKLPKNILVNGDPIENYLVFTTSHDGSSGVKILFTPIRVVCKNTLNAAIRSSSNYVSFRHTKSVKENLGIAASILGICDETIYFLNQQYNEMFKKKISDIQAQNIFASAVLSEDEMTNINLTGHNITQIILRDNNAINDAQISMKKVNALSEMNNYYFAGIGQQQFLGTAYGAYNAVNGYYSNVDNSEGTKRMDSLLFGDKSRKIKLAGDYALAI